MKQKLLLNTLFPPRCCGCDCLTGSNRPVCEDCEKLVLHPSARVSACDICAQPIKECICKKHQYYSRLIACFHYEGEPVKTIFKLKFRSRPDIAEGFARLICDGLKERKLINDIDIITFVPMRGIRRFLRGYNQSELIARHLSEYSGIPYKKLLEKKYDSSSQHKLNAVTRTGNLLGCFEPIRDNADLFADKTVLVIDDVLTTGSTMNEIAKTLLIFGADSVYAAACAVTKRKKSY